MAGQSLADLPPNYNMIDVADTGQGCFLIINADFSIAYGINDTARRAVGQGENTCAPLDPYVAFLRYLNVNDDAMVALSSHDGPDGAAFAVIDTGQMVGWAHDNIFGENYVRPTLWGHNGNEVNLATIGGNDTDEGEVYDMDDNLRLVGKSEDDNDISHASYWAFPSTPIDLGALVTNAESSARGKNANNDIVGWSHDASGVQVAILWESTGSETWSMISLPTLGGISIAHDINDSKVIVGSSVLGNVRFAVKWEYDDVNSVWVITNLGLFPGGLKSEAFAINNAGDIVGHSRIGVNPGSERATMWSGSSMYNLSDRFCRYNVNNGTNWVLHELRDINNSGDIAGWGHRDGLAKPRPFVLKTIDCVGDVNGNGETNVADLLLLLGSWGPGCKPADLDNSDAVSTADLLILLADWGCPGSEEFPASYAACIDRYMPDLEAVEACITALILSGG